MLDPRQYSTSSPFAYFEPLQTYLEQPFPRTLQDFLDMEQQLYKTAAEVGDHLVLMQIEAAHSDRAFVKGVQSRYSQNLGYSETGIFRR